MSRLIIHAGLHKTASTSVQQMLLSNRNLLRKRGVNYPTPNQGANHGLTSGAHHGLVARWNKQLSRYTREYPAGRDPWDIIAGSETQYPTTILSSEEFSRVGPREVDFDELIKLTPGFEKREVVTVLRDPVPYVQSVFLQQAPHMPYCDFGAWLIFSRSRNFKNAGIFTNYWQLNGRLVRGFGRENTSYITYEKICSHPQGPGGGFLSHVGLPRMPRLTTPPRQNVSPCPLSFQIARRFNNFEIPTMEQIATTREALLSRKPGKVRTSVYRKAEVAMVDEDLAPMIEKFTEIAGSRLDGTLKSTPTDLSTLYACEVDESDLANIQKALNVSVSKGTH